MDGVLLLLRSMLCLFFQAIKHWDKDDSEFGIIIEDCLHLLASLVKVSLSWVRRSANQSAHCLASVVESLSGPSVWFDVAPSFLSAVLDFDSY